ncbi:MAG: sulfatase-like hydrolase/transferase [Pirellulales bacterium]|nr:sulfatase-like hydrolase/transferase [Pirellulales bacterium]
MANYHPDTKLFRYTYARYHDRMKVIDQKVGGIVKQLKDDGLLEDTFIFYFGDHGANNLVRHKQMPTEGGLHVPLIIAGPDPYVPAPAVRDDLVDLLDLSATTLAWAGVKKPDWYEGQNLFDEKLVPRFFVASAKDRLDHTIDRVRTIRTDRFRYTRNYKTDRIFLQPQYRDPKNFVVNLRQLYASGELSPKLTEIYFGQRPDEELYDVKKDPSQLHNLAKDPKFADELQRHRKWLDDWLAKGDDGAGEESQEELAYQARDHKWGRAVNPEYELVRTDSDGDGLSDDWERINGRDPQDGKLLFTFDCGGWQTEGWEGTPTLGNIAGRQGYLDFVLSDRSGVIVRRGLKLKAANHRGPVTIRMRSSHPVEVDLSAGVQDDDQLRRLGAAKLDATKDFVEQVIVPAGKWPSDTVVSLQIAFASDSEAVVEIDSIATK